MRKRDKTRYKYIDKKVGYKIRSDDINQKMLSMLRHWL